MGWFDDSDDSDEDKKRKRKRPLETFDIGGCSAGSRNDNGINSKQAKKEEGKENEKEAVDPLDAFMDNLKSTAAIHTGPTTNTSTKDITQDDNALKRNEKNRNARVIDRLDMENEDEATAHWQIPTTPQQTVATRPSEMNNATSSFNQPYTNRSNQNECYSSSQTKYLQAKSAMESVFHKAGEKNMNTIIHSSSSMIDNNNGGDHEKQQEKYKASLLVKNEREDNEKEHYSLDVINHDKKQYPSFRKVFLTCRTIQQYLTPPQDDNKNNNQDQLINFGRSWRKDNNIKCSIEDVDPILTFDQYGISLPFGHDDAAAAVVQGVSEEHDNDDDLPLFDSAILAYLNKNNFKTATLVQAQSIPVALCGKDLLVTSHTGSGKTLAYVLPMITHVLDQPHIQPKVDGPIAIILTPTRELAKQVHLIAKKLLQLVHGKAVSVTGGMGTYEMVKELQKGCEVIISTPGRLIDMVKKKATNFNRVTMIILDEADKMLDMGFEKQVACILDNVRPDRQTFMFSATFGKRVERVAKGWLNDPVRIAVGRAGASSEHVDQHVFVLPSYEAKKNWLMEMLPMLAGLGKMIIFVASKADCESIAKLLKNSPAIGGQGLLTDSIHGDKHQIDRNAAMSSFRKGKLAALVATDVASRGLDVDNIQTVVNFDAAKNLDSHVHRIGRAGRLSRNEKEIKKGIAYTLLTHKNADFAKTLMESFEREGREVGDDLSKLAMKSKHYGGGGKQKWNKTGLGFDTGGHSNRESYYGPSSHISDIQGINRR